MAEHLRTRGATRRTLALLASVALALVVAPPLARGASLPPPADADSPPPPSAPNADGLPPGGDRGTAPAVEPTIGRPTERGPETVFFRADDFAALHAQTFAVSYGIESGEHLTDTPKRFGIKHRLQAGFGATPWLKLSVEQNMKNNGNTGELRVGVLAPQVRLTLRGMLPASAGQWPLDVSAFAGPRIRIQGRREPSVVAGVGSNTPRGRLHFTVNQGLEIARSNPSKGIESEFGPRYDLGVGYELGLGLVASAEMWGHVAWSRGGYSEQEHHAGPSLLFVLGPARFALGGAMGWRDERGTELWDVSAMLTTGLEI